MNNEKLYLTNTHPDSFRPGQSAEILGTEWVRIRKTNMRPLELADRLCFRVRYPDGVEDFVAIKNSDNYKLSSEPEPQKLDDLSPEIVVVLKNRIPTGEYIVTYTGDPTACTELIKSGKGLRVETCVTDKGQGPTKHLPYFRVPYQSLTFKGHDLQTVQSWFPTPEDEISSFVVKVRCNPTPEKPNAIAVDTGEQLMEGMLAYIIFTGRVWATVVARHDKRTLYANKENAERHILYNSPQLSLEEVCAQLRELDGMGLPQNLHRSFRKRLKRLLQTKQK